MFHCLVFEADSEKKDVKQDDGGEEREVREGYSRGGEGESESTAEKHLPEDPGLWPEQLINHQRDVVCRLARKGAEKTDITKMAPKDMEGQTIPKLSSVCKVREILKRFFKDV